MILLYNSFSKRKEILQPINPGKVGMYVCGPTVYDNPHIGNARSVVIFDILYRLLIHKYGFENVTYVRNITDVDDKINQGAKDRKITIQELTTEIYKIFHNNIKNLNCLSPNIEPKATEHIQDMINLIEKLLANNHAYHINNHVYFDVISDHNYGCLASRDLDKMIAGSRVEVDRFKKNPADFVLWKPADKDDDASSVFDSPWGKGRPGWHIECSAMSYKYLGENFDIHGGGADLMFPHHSNEIAQSTCAFKNSIFAKVWVHNGFLTVNKEKMSKSLGNFITVEDLLNRGVKGEAIRYLLLSTHYKKPLDFNDNMLEISMKSLDGFYRILQECAFSDVEGLSVSDNVIEAISDDLNSPKALSILHDLTKEYHKECDIVKKHKIAGKLLGSANFIGLLQENYKSWFEVQGSVNQEIMSLIEKRNNAKAKKDYQLTDKIRDYLKTKNIILEDHKDGTTTWRKI